VLSNVAVVSKVLPVSNITSVPKLIDVPLTVPTIAVPCEELASSV